MVTLTPYIDKLAEAIEWAVRADNGIQRTLVGFPYTVAQKLERLSLAASAARNLREDQVQAYVRADRERYLPLIEDANERFSPLTRKLISAVSGNQLKTLHSFVGTPRGSTFQLEGLLSLDKYLATGDLIELMALDELVHQALAYYSSEEVRAIARNKVIAIKRIRAEEFVLDEFSAQYASQLEGFESLILELEVLKLLEEPFDD